MSSICVVRVGIDVCDRPPSGVADSRVIGCLTADPDIAAARTSRHHRIPHTLTSNPFGASGGQHMTTRVSAVHPIRVISRGRRRRMAAAEPGDYMGLSSAETRVFGRSDRLCGPRVCHLDGERPRDTALVPATAAVRATGRPLTTPDLPTLPAAAANSSAPARERPSARTVSQRSRAARPHQSTRTAPSVEYVLSTTSFVRRDADQNVLPDTRATDAEPHISDVPGPTRSRRTRSRTSATDSYA